MKNFERRIQEFINIYNIPIEENWHKYLQKNHMNYFQYMASMGIAPKVENNAEYSNIRIKDNIVLRNFLRNVDVYYETQRMNNKIIVDVGCGWGFHSFWFLLSGAEKVFGLGFPYQIEFVNKLVESIKERNLIENITNLQGIAEPLNINIKTLGSLNYNFADMVIYNEVFEHIPNHIFDDALVASYNTLKKGGKLISITHNSDNPQVLKSLSHYWDKLENEQFKNERKKIILSKIPEINLYDLEKVIDGTRGLFTRQVNEIIENYKTKKEIPVSRDNSPAVDLKYDYLCENYISPKSVVEKMKKAGFKSYVYAAIEHGRRFIPFRPFVKVFKDFFMSINSFSRVVVFIGEKK